ncbi:MAG: AMP-binding protein [Novosphingobium sp.]|nr:AMP-binding protein [Novosphingobium sp.]
MVLDDGARQGEYLVDLLRKHTNDRPDALCLTLDNETLSFAQLNDRSSRLGNALLSKGIAKGDRIALIARTSMISYDLLYACGKIGATILPMNWRLSAREVADIIADATPSLVIVASEFRPLLDLASGGFDVIEIESGYDEWRDSGDNEDPRHSIAPDDPLILLYTSGTTGLPKGVVITQKNMTFVDRTAGEIWNFGPESVNIVSTPLYHIGGIGYGMMGFSQGGHTVLVAQAEAESIVEAMHRYGGTHGFFVPTVIQRIVDKVELDGVAPDRLELIIYGASRMGHELLVKAMRLLGCGFSNAYGLTESTGTVVSMGPEDHDPERAPAERLASCGCALPWAEIELVDPASGRVVEVGEVGEIRIRSDAVMAGYWNKPEVTAETITPDGWLCTGDAAYRDEYGYLYIQDRFKDMIISGGENIYPAEIESALHDHPDIAEIAVIGVPHPKWGETPRAYIVPATGCNPMQDEILEYARARLARYKCPTSIVFVEALPRNVSGKVLKREMRSSEWQKSAAVTARNLSTPPNTL